MKKKNTAARKIATVVVVGGMLAIFLFDIVSVALSGLWEKRFPLTELSSIDRKSTRLNSSH